MSLKGKKDYFLKSAFSVESLSRIALTSSLGHVGGPSEEWGTGSAAYGRRLGARYAGYLTGRSVQFGIGALRGEDPRFYRSGKEGFRARFGFVLSRTVVVQMDDGRRSIAAGKLAGTFASNTTTVFLRPNPSDPWKTGLTNSGISLVSDIGVRTLREFWPDLRKAFRH